jgi:hypothetical protein
MHHVFPTFGEGVKGAAEQAGGCTGSLDGHEHSSVKQPA